MRTCMHIGALVSPGQGGRAFVFPEESVTRDSASSQGTPQVWVRVWEWNCGLMYKYTYTYIWKSIRLRKCFSACMRAELLLQVLWFSPTLTLHPRYHDQRLQAAHSYPTLAQPYTQLLQLAQCAPHDLRLMRFGMIRSVHHCWIERDVC